MIKVRYHKQNVYRHLTVGEFYHVKENDTFTDCYDVKNDIGKYQLVEKSFFTTMDKIRAFKLRQLGI